MPFSKCTLIIKQMIHFIISVCIVIVMALITWLLYRHLCIANVCTLVNDIGYFERFNSIDLAVRKCYSIHECKNKYFKGLRLMSICEKLLLSKYIKTIQRHINSKSMFYQIPFRVVMFNPSSENGYPHTHGNIIMLPDGFLNSFDENKIDTLLHEQIHVYQKLYPLDFLDLYINFWGFDLLGITTDDKSRSNPDTNLLVFADSQGKPIHSTYAHDATQLTDIIDPRDHPNEMSAYMLPSLLLSHRYQTKIDQIAVKQLEQWAEKYMIINKR